VASEPESAREKRVTPFELYFDLVFVFAFTQVTGLLAANLTWGGVLRGMLVLAALWWAWGAYAWLATTTDLAEGPTRLVMLVVIVAMLAVGLATPRAFTDDALVFALAYAAVRLLHLVLYAVAARDDPRLLRAVLGLVPGSMFSATMILIATQFDGSTEVILWTIGLLFDYGAPAVIDPGGWQVNAAHFAERFGLIYIIALGESLISIGVGAQGLDVTVGLLAVASLGVVVVTALWWTYFDVVAIVAEWRLTTARGGEQQALARDSYSYLHLPMVAGVILFAVGAKKAVAHPGDSLETVAAVSLAGGIAIYLVAQVLVRLRNVGTLSRPRCIAAAALAGIAAAGTSTPAVVQLLLVAAVAAGLVAWESVRYREVRRQVRSGTYIPVRHR
jgi:low temperature requirement protein LtrA